MASLTAQKIEELFNLKKIRITTGEAKYIEYAFSGVEKEEAIDIINGIKRQKLWGKGVDEYHIFDAQEIISAITKKSDWEMYRKLNAIYATFINKYVVKNKGFQRGMNEFIRGLLDRIEIANNKINSNVARFSEENVEILSKLSVLYNVIALHIPLKEQEISEKISKTGERKLVKTTTFTRIADYVLQESILKQVKDESKFLKSLKLEDIDEFGKLLSAMQELDPINSEETFTEEDVYDLIKKSKSIFGYATAEKYHRIKEALKTYMSAVAELPETTKEQKQHIMEKTAKSIMKRSGTILTNAPDLFKENIALMMGADVKSVIYPQKDSKIDLPKKSKYVLMGTESEKIRDKENKTLAAIFPNLRLKGMTPEHHIYLMEKHVSAYSSLNLSSLHDIATGMLDIMYAGLIGDPKKEKQLHLKKRALQDLGFDIEDILHADNLIDLLDSAKYLRIANNTAKKIEKTRVEREKIKDEIIKNIKFLSTMIVPSDLQTIVKHNFNIFRQDNKKLVADFTEMKQNSIDDLSFAIAVNEYLNKPVVAQNLKSTDSEEEDNSNVTTTRRKYTSKIKMPIKANIDVDLIEDMSSIVSVENKLTLMITELINSNDKIPFGEYCDKVKSVLSLYSIMRNRKDYTKEKRNSIGYLMSALEDDVELKVELLKEDIVRGDNQTTPYYLESRKHKKSLDVKPLQEKISKMESFVELNPELAKEFVKLDKLQENKSLIGTELQRRENDHAMRELIKEAELNSQHQKRKLNKLSLMQKMLARRNDTKDNIDMVIENQKLEIEKLIEDKKSKIAKKEAEIEAKEPIFLKNQKKYNDTYKSKESQSGSYAQKLSKRLSADSMDIETLKNDLAKQKQDLAELEHQLANLDDSMEY